MVKVLLVELDSVSFYCCHESSKAINSLYNVIIKNGG